MAETEDIIKLSDDKIPKFILEELPIGVECQHLSELLDEAKQTIHTRWVDYMVSAFNDLPETDQKHKLFTTFKDDATLRSMLQQENFRGLETLRLLGEGQLWYEIVNSISEREKSCINLAKYWVSQMSDSEIEKLSLSRNEINLFLDLSLAIQEPIDQAYIHQLVLADAPGGKQLGPYAKVFGYEYLYQDNTPYFDVYPEEFSQLVSTLEFFSNKIDQDTKDGQLPPIYSDLAQYLKTLADSYGSQDTEVEKIIETWTKVDEQYINLAQSECPIIITPWGFLVDGNHIGIELMVTLSLGKTSYWYHESQEYSSIVKDFMKDYEPDFVPNPFIHQYVFARNGINLPWSGTACAGDRYVVFYDNENDNYAHNIYQSNYHRFIDGHTTEEKFALVRGENTISHETGHLARMIDQDRYERMGIVLPTNKLDECKADCMSNIYFLKKMQKYGSLDISPEEYLEQYVVSYIDEIRNSINHENEDLGVVWYAFSAKVIMAKLFECGSIIWSGDKIKIIDGLLGTKVLAQLGLQIFDRYGEESFGEEEVRMYVQYLEDEALANADLQRFLLKVAESR